MGDEVITESQLTMILERLGQTLVKAFRESLEPAPIPNPQLVTIGVNSESKLDALLFCPDCLGDHGSRFGARKEYMWFQDPEKPDRAKRREVEHENPPVLKTISYDATAAKAGLEAGTHGKQCLACGVLLHPELRRVV